MRVGTSLWLLVVLLVSSACDSRPPLTRGQAIGSADQFQLTQGTSWGEPIEVLPPGLADVHGRRWWQVRYADGTDGMHVVLVDDASGWAKRIGAAELVHVASSARLPVPATAADVAVADGSWVVLIEPFASRDSDADTALEREAARLNALANAAGHYPLCSVRHDAAGRSALVYGWQGDRGLVRDERLIPWLAEAGHRTATWVDLLQ